VASCRQRHEFPHPTAGSEIVADLIKRLARVDFYFAAHDTTAEAAAGLVAELSVGIFFENRFFIPVSFPSSSLLGHNIKHGSSIDVVKDSCV